MADAKRALPALLAAVGTKRAELCGAGPEVPHGPADGKAVRGTCREHDKTEE